MKFRGEYKYQILKIMYLRQQHQCGGEEIGNLCIGK
jgi:hypothetical protein